MKHFHSYLIWLLPQTSSVSYWETSSGTCFEDPEQKDHSDSKFTDQNNFFEHREKQVGNHKQFMSHDVGLLLEINAVKIYNLLCYFQVMEVSFFNFHISKNIFYEVTLHHKDTDNTGENYH